MLRLTRGICSNCGCAVKNTAPRCLGLPLVITVHSIITVVLDSVWVKTSPILKYCWTISSSSTSIIYVFLENWITLPSIANAISCICESITHKIIEKIARYGSKIPRKWIKITSFQALYCPSEKGKKCIQYKWLNTLQEAMNVTWMNSHGKQNHWIH